MAVCPTADLINAAEANGTADEIGMAQGEVERVISPETGPRR